MSDREYLERLVGEKMLSTFEGEERLFRMEGQLNPRNTQKVSQFSCKWETVWGDRIIAGIEPRGFSLHRTPLFGISWDTRWSMRNDPTTKKDVSLERELIRWILRQERIRSVEGECLAVDSDRCVRLNEEPLIRDCRQCSMPGNTWGVMLKLLGKDWASLEKDTWAGNRDIGFGAEVATEGANNKIHIWHYGGTFNTFPGGRWKLEKK
ncbi:MAG: hypothetical protein WCT01_02420 [Candidatus Shapirobacteria bacterium]